MGSYTTSEIKIYSLNCPISGMAYYIGKTTSILSFRLACHLADKKSVLKREWISGLNKNGLLPTIKLIKICKNNNRAIYAERFYIKLFGRKVNGTGILTNNALGGDTIQGFIQSEHSKRLMSNSKKGKPLYYLRKPVFQIDLHTGKIIKEFPSINEAQKETGIINSAILGVCKGAKYRNRAGNYYWCYKSEYHNFKFSRYKEHLHIAKSIKHIDRITGEVIYFDNMQLAANFYKIDRADISRMVNKNIYSKKNRMFHKFELVSQ